jgi:hypothetical protein
MKEVIVKGTSPDGSYIINCRIFPRRDQNDAMFTQAEVGGPITSVKLDGYTIIPNERFDELMAANSAMRQELRVRDGESA